MQFKKPILTTALSTTLTCVFIAAGIAACGGGSSGNSAPIVRVTPPPPPPPPPPPAANFTPQPFSAKEGQILVNQIGFTPEAEKLAILVKADTAPVAWELRDSTGAISFQGNSVYFGENIQSEHPVHHIDFSDFKTKGTDYSLWISGTKRSPDFDIEDRPLKALKEDSLSYFYQSRVGQAVDAAYVPLQTPPLSRAAGHETEIVTCFTGTDTRRTIWPSCGYTLDVSGGWYDAGDYGKYSVNTGFATWAMLNMAETQQKAASSATCSADLNDGALKLPENNNGIADILDEARHGVEFLLNMQVQSDDPVSLALGTQSGTGPLTLTSKPVTGMVHHKVHGEVWPTNVVPPAQDTTKRSLYPPSTAATYHLAAIGGQCARVFATVDADFAKQCLEAGEKAYQAALNTPDAYAYNNFDGGGPYDDQELDDEKFWAATELWLATGKTTYQSVLADPASRYNVVGSYTLNPFLIEYMGALSLLANTSAGPSNVDISDEKEKARLSVEILAGRYAAQTPTTGMAIPYDDTNYYWGSNGNLLNRAMILATAHDLTGDRNYKSNVKHVMDYLLGRNPMEVSYVSGHGDTPFENPHHRFWANSLDATTPKPPPGVLSGGPNNVNYIDPVGSTLRGDCIGQTCWRDDANAYSLNEVAINWNAALAWTANWVDRKDASCP